MRKHLGGHILFVYSLIKTLFTFRFNDSGIWRASQWCIVCSYDKGFCEHKQTIAIYIDVIIFHNGQLTAWVADNIALANMPFLSTVLRYNKPTKSNCHTVKHSMNYWITCLCRKLNCSLGFKLDNWGFG